ncbi:PocR ligand-binding domain-containing protein [Marinisporobacter balticus]|uniref:Ligand-binding sensor protein n=1 Tax=Marinisporobacter balticus TaxID=2018667 RepID=A0A4V2SC45_9FIRM|nr:PocR ligand-binding domain-containing protein [Marinisporobacter balticus]TCO77950.1 ligand-binding sensor protein [Marinisporobacter balticus]
MLKKETLDFSKIRLSEIIDLDFLQRFQDDFAESVGVASISVDMEGNPISQPSNFRKFCMDLTRKSSEGLRRCKECDVSGGKISADTGKPYIYGCHAGLVDFAAPIIVEGRQIGAILGGQVLTEKPDLEKIRRIAFELEIDPNIYVEALEEVEILSKRKVEKAADLLFLVANTISQMGYNRLRIKKATEDLDENIHQIVKAIDEMAGSSVQVTENQNDLNNEIQTINTVSREINNFLDFIKKISNRTKLLGLNASIEAARAGHVGVGFGVVAKEIQKLADESKETVDKINDFTENIIKTVDGTVEKGKESLIGVEQQVAAIQEINANIQALAFTVENMVDLIV